MKVRGGFTTEISRRATIHVVESVHIVLVEDQRSHIENGEWHVDEVAVIRPLPDGNEVLLAVRAAHGSTFVYHTKHPEIVMPIRSKPVYRGTA